MDKKMETTVVYWGYIGVTLGHILGEWKLKWKLLQYYRVYIRRMDNKMETIGSIGLYTVGII